MASRIYGHLDEYPVGYTFENREAMFKCGMHPTKRAGIAFPPGNYRAACSIVVRPGEYGDDNDDGVTLIYTGAGGHPDKGKLSEDQQWLWTNGNQNLRKSGEEKKSVRVIRGAPTSKARSKLSNPYLYPTAGFRYDGLYYVTNFSTKRSEYTNHKICSFTLQRIPGQAPPPWLSSETGPGSNSVDNNSQFLLEGSSSDPIIISDNESTGNLNQSDSEVEVEEALIPQPTPELVNLIPKAVNNVKLSRDSNLIAQAGPPDASSTKLRGKSVENSRSQRSMSPRYSPYSRPAYDPFKNESAQERRSRMATNKGQKEKLQGFTISRRKK